VSSSNVLERTAKVGEMKHGQAGNFKDVTLIALKTGTFSKERPMYQLRCHSDISVEVTTPSASSRAANTLGMKKLSG